MRTQRFNQLAAFLPRNPPDSADDCRRGTGRRQGRGPARGAGGWTRRAARLTAPGRANAAWKGRVVRVPAPRGRRRRAGGTAPRGFGRGGPPGARVPPCVPSTVLPNLRLVLSVVNRCGPTPRGTGRLRSGGSAGTDASRGEVRPLRAAAGSRLTPIGGFARPSFRQNSATAASVTSRRE